MKNLLAKLGILGLAMSLTFGSGQANAGDPQFDKIVDDYFDRAV